MIKLYYDKINFQINEKNEDKNQVNKNSKKPIFILDYKKNYMISFQGIPMIFNKKEDQFDSVTLLSKNYDFFTEYKFIKDKDLYKVSIPYKEIDNNLLEMKKNIQ